jgi:mono/diheme cytochrome c family protein
MLSPGFDHPRGVSIVRRLWAAVSLVALVAGLGVAAGCVDSSEEEAQTPSDAPTVVNSAIQTDSEGNRVTAPAATEAGGEEGGAAGGSATGGAATGGGGGGEAPAGDAAAGEQFFSTTCTTCHLNNGQDAGGVGPQLAGQGLDEEYIRTTVMNGRGAMPPGLATGEDLDNVVAYVLSIQ